MMNAIHSRRTVRHTGTLLTAALLMALVGSLATVRAQQSDDASQARAEEQAAHAADDPAGTGSADTESAGNAATEDASGEQSSNANPEAPGYWADRQIEMRQQPTAHIAQSSRVCRLDHRTSL